jgi:hydroxymethylglutaryl-CoA lyase
MSRLTEIYPNDRITLREVGLRDGLQLVKTWPQTADKKRWMATEYGAGVSHFEVGSFLPAARYPQFADVRELASEARRRGAFSAALALNERGAEDALASDVDEIVCVVSATEEHSQANARRSRQDAISLVQHLADIRNTAGAGKLINVTIAMSLGCSIAGAVDPDEVIRIAEATLAAGADIVAFADTVGYGGPRQVGELAVRMNRLCGSRPFIVHLHDTRGMGIANASAALDNGARVLDASLGGLGGCPFAPGATGNIVFEDVVFLCETKGFATGIDPEGLRAAREIAEASMPTEQFHGALAKSGPPVNMPWRAR